MMKVVVAIAALLMCSGCASKYVNLYYYPNVQDPERLPRIAQKECAKFGLAAVQEFGALNPASGGRAYVSFRCEPRYGTPANPAPEAPTFYAPDLPTDILPDFLK